MTVWIHKRAGQGAAKQQKRRKWESVSPWASGGPSYRCPSLPFPPPSASCLLVLRSARHSDQRPPFQSHYTHLSLRASHHPHLAQQLRPRKRSNKKAKTSSASGVDLVAPSFPRHARHFRPGVAPSLVPSASAAVSSQARVSTASSTATVPGRLTSKLPCPASKDSNTTSSNEVPDVTVQP